MCSILLGIWATAGTIALRNFLLVVAAVLSIIYIRKYSKVNHDSFLEIQSWRRDPLCFLPTILVMVMLIWVVLHYVFFSQIPDQQWDELTSTWLRAFLAAIVGFGCAIAVRRNQNYVLILWLGLVVSFMVLVYQYIPKATAIGSLFAPDYGSYIYRAKFNGVLAGIILFTGALGILMDRLYPLLTDSNTKSGESHRLIKIILLFAITLSLFLPVFSFVFIFNAKNGVGVAAILLVFWFTVGGFFLGIQFFKNDGALQLGQKSINLITMYFLIILMFLSFFFVQVKINPGWEFLFEDIHISAQVHSIENWKSPNKYGYPKRSDGSTVAGNTYERVAWAVVGLTIIIDHPLGNGVQRGLPSQMQQAGVNFNESAYTHSAWIDFGLSYGLPGMLLLPTALLLCLIACIKKYRGANRATVASMAVSLLTLYTLGEYAFQHGIEILFFLSALLSGLILPNQKSISNHYSVQ